MSIHFCKLGAYKPRILVLFRIMIATLQNTLDETNCSPTNGALSGARLKCSLCIYEYVRCILPTLVSCVLECKYFLKLLETFLSIAVQVAMQTCVILKRNWFSVYEFAIVLESAQAPHYANTSKG